MYNINAAVKNNIKTILSKKQKLKPDEHRLWE